VEHHVVMMIQAVTFSPIHLISEMHMRK